MKASKIIFTINAIVILLPFITYSQPTNIAINTSGNQRETAITVDPNDPDHLMATWNDFSISSPPYQPGYAFSTDGGETWSTSTFDDEGFDPSCAVDNSGRAYYTYVASGAVQISYTTNDGQQWPNTYQVSSSSSDQDKPYMAVDNTGGTYNGRLYVAWTDFSNGNAIDFAYSTNQGASWTQQTIQTRFLAVQPEMFLRPSNNKTSPSSSSPLLQSPVPTVGPDGTVYIVYQDLSDYYTSGSSAKIQFT